MEKRKILIFAGCLCIAGAFVAGAGFAMMDFNVMGLSRTAGNYKKISKDVKNINTKKNVKLNFRHQNIKVVPSSDEDMHITYYDKKDKQEYKVVENATTFMIHYEESKETTFNLLFNFNIYEEDHNVELQLPKDYKGTLDLNTTYGEIEMNGFEELEEINISTTHENVILNRIKTEKDARIVTTHGYVNVSDLETKRLMDVSSTHGNLEFKNIHAQELQAQTTYGKIDVKEIQSDSDIQLRSTHEDILMYDVRSKERIDVNTTYGLIRFDDLDAKELRFETTHESIDGNLKGALQEYQVTYSVSHGESNIMETNEGQKKLYMKTTYGDIDVSFDS